MQKKIIRGFSRRHFARSWNFSLKSGSCESRIRSLEWTKVDLPTQKDWWKEPFPLFRLGRWWLLMDFCLKTCNLQHPTTCRSFHHLYGGSDDIDSFRNGVVNMLNTWKTVPNGGFEGNLKGSKRFSVCFFCCSANWEWYQKCLHNMW